MFLNILIVVTLELLPTETRATGFAFCICTGLAAAISIPFIEVMGTKILLFTGLMFAASILGVFSLVETRNSELMEFYYSSEVVLAATPR